MNFQENTSAGAKGFVHGLNDAIRENPLAAGLIGMGVFWMLFRNSKVTSMAGQIPSALKGAADSVGAAAAAGGSSMGAGLAAAGSQISNTARNAADTIGEIATNSTKTARENMAGVRDLANAGGLSDTVAQAADAVREGVRNSAQWGREFGTPLKQTLTENLERQPLLLGAIGLAIGAGLAAAFPSTDIESDLMGRSGSAAREKLEELATETKSRANQVLGDIKQEAQTQGLTPSGAKDAFSGVAEKVKTVAGSARQSVANRMS